MMMEETGHGIVDPDPVTIASLWLSAGSFILALIQTWKSFNPSSPPKNPEAAGSRVQSLSSLERSLESLLADLKEIQKSIERGSNNSDAQYFDAPFRVAQTQLLLPKDQANVVSQALARAYARVGDVGLWINHLIIYDPETAFRLGQRIAGGLDGVEGTLNDVLARGGPNRTIQAEGRRTIDALAKAIEAELALGGN